MTVPQSSPSRVSALPNPQALEALRLRFSCTDLSHPCIATLFNFALEKLPRESESRPARPKSEKAETPPEEVIPLDPINILQMEVRLPPLPAVFNELQEITNKPYASASDVGQVVAKDPSLTAWVLKLVNSPFFGFIKKVETVTRAIAMLGLEQFKTLAMGNLMNSLAQGLPKGVINMDAVWRHSIATAICARELWKLLDRGEPERLFVSGLLHDCGYLALAYAAPKTFTAVRQHIRREAQPGYITEQALLGFDHARLGGMLLHRWNMPLPLVMSALLHHVVKAPEKYPEAAVVHLSNIIAIAVSGTETDIVPPLDPDTWKFLGLKPRQINTVADSMLTSLNSMSEMLAM